jgi:hypothetical protein
MLVQLAAYAFIRALVDVSFLEFLGNILGSTKNNLLKP